ncbi:MAG: hypothetical protein RIQ92_782, partial [Actinomycetota bacterium]
MQYQELKKFHKDESELAGILAHGVPAVAR